MRCLIGVVCAVYAMGGCAGVVVPPELVHARVLLEQSTTGAPGGTAAVEIESARRAVARADASFVAHPGSRTTLGLAFVAEHMAFSAHARSRPGRTDDVPPSSACP